MTHDMQLKEKCPTCVGSKIPWALGEYCDAHDVCNSCGIHRSKLEGVAWGERYGAFKCSDCEKRERKARVTERQKVGFDHEYTNEITCPYCGHEEGDSWEAAESDDARECPDCEEVFSYERIVTVEYSTSKLEE